jgi:2-(1,2-epoxy-1,2-dihydrophenyl)acetyl-CoA isomerase
MSFETLLITRKKEVVTITLNRPKRLNSFNLTLGDELFEALREIRYDPSVHIVILRGEGKGFCGGGDVKDMYASSNRSHYLRDLTRSIHRCVLEMREMEKPVVAVVHGAAAGAGLSLMLACDIIIAAEGTRFNTAFLNIGLAPGCGTYFITRLVGYHRACELVLTTREFSTSEAMEWGIINQVAQQDALEETLEDYISRFLRLPHKAVGMAKTLLNESLRNDLVSHLEFESQMAACSAGSPDFSEAIQAFVEKRPPRFKDDIEP